MLYSVPKHDNTFLSGLSAEKINDTTGRIEREKKPSFALSFSDQGKYYTFKGYEKNTQIFSNVELNPHLLLYFTRCNKAPN